MSYCISRTICLPLFPTLSSVRACLIVVADPDHPPNPLCLRDCCTLFRIVSNVHLASRKFPFFAWTVLQNPWFSRLRHMAKKGTRPWSKASFNLLAWRA